MLFCFKIVESFSFIQPYVILQIQQIGRGKGLESGWYTVRFEDATDQSFAFRAEVLNKEDKEYYYWKVYGLAPYTKYRFRVAIVLKRVLEGPDITFEEGPELMDDTIDINRMSSIVTQPSFVVRTDPSETELPSKPIIISVRQVRL